MSQFNFDDAAQSVAGKWTAPFPAQEASQVAPSAPSTQHDPPGPPGTTVVPAGHAGESAQILWAEEDGQLVADTHVTALLSEEQPFGDVPQVALAVKVAPTRKAYARHSASDATADPARQSEDCLEYPIEWHTPPCVLSMGQFCAVLK